MKKVLLSLLVCIVIFSGCGKPTPTPNPEVEMDCTTLKVFSWGEYVDKSTLTKFENTYGVNIIYDEYDSNESMYTKLLSGESYDILVPSDYMIERLIQEGKLQPVDLKLIPNFEGIIESLKNPTYDPGNVYSVPYFWGNVGIIYNKNVVTEAELDQQGWAILKNPKYKGRVYMYDSERDSFMIAFKDLGFSMNTSNEAEIEQATQWLIDLDTAVKPVYITDEVFDMMSGGSKDLAVSYNGEGAWVTSENSDMGFYVPKSGTNVWVDGMVIMKDSVCPIASNTYINFMADPEQALANTVEVGYTTTVQSVYDEVTGPGGDFEGNAAYEPRLEYELDETFKHNEVLKKELSQRWLKVKAR